MNDINGYVKLFNSRDAAKTEAAKARTAGLFYRVVDASESPPGRHKKKARGVWTIQGGGIDIDQRPDPRPLSTYLLEALSVTHRANRTSICSTLLSRPHVALAAKAVGYHVLSILVVP